MTFLHNCWYVACGSEEVLKPLARTIINTDLVIYRGEGGSVFALDNDCPHRFAPLDRGTVYGDAIQCRYHGLRFDGHGKCVLVPSGDPAPPRAEVRAYPVVERYGLVWLWMGRAELADPKQIPDFAYLEGPGFGWYNAYLYVQGGYELLVDNLLDLSHVEFLHPMLRSQGRGVRTIQTISRDGDTIYVDNVANNDIMSPLLQRMRPDMNPMGTQHQSLRWDAPSHLRLYFEFHNADDTLVIPSGHFLTPETETTTHYIVRGGPQGVVDPAQIAAAKAGIVKIFSEEDVPMIEAQQRFLGNDELLDRHPAILKSDAPAISARRLLAARIRSEQADAVAPALQGAKN